MTAASALVGCAFAFLSLGTARPAHGQPHTPPAAVAQPYSAAAHDAAVLAWREGRLAGEDLLAQLHAWQGDTAEHAAQRRIHTDRIVVAGRLGRADEVVALARGRPLEDVLPYGLEPVIAAARALGDQALQGAAVQRLLQEQAGSWDAVVHEAMWLLDRGRLAEGRARIEALAQRPQASVAAQRADVAELRAALAEASGRPAEALLHYQDVSTLRPEQGFALRAQVRLLRELGTPHAALRLAQQQQPQGALQEALLQQEALGERLRWAVDAAARAGGAQHRFHALDEVLQDMATLAAQWERGAAAEAASDLAPLRGRLLADRLQGLYERGRAEEAVALYGQALATPLPVPYHGVGAAAAAWARLRRPDLAVPLYEQALREAGTALRVPSPLHTGLVYAYLDTGRFAQAEALVQELLRQTPPLQRLTPEPGRANDEYGALLALAARVDLYARRTDQAQRQFDALAAEAPLSPDFRTGQAAALRARRQPMAALQVMQALVHAHPDDPQVRADHAEALLDAGWLGAGRAQLQALQATHEGLPVLRSATQLAAAVLGPRLEVLATAGRDGGTLSESDQGLQLRLSSGWQGDAWRLVFTQWLGRAWLQDATVEARRTGLALEMRRGPWFAAAGLHHTDGRGRSSGAAASLRWRADDRWQLQAHWDSHAVDVPWRARRAGITAAEGQLAASHLLGDRGELNAEASHLRLTDGNRRYAGALGWRQEWVQAPRFGLATHARLETARHARSDVPYFSPLRASAATLEAEAEWLTWKRDVWQWVQQVQAGGGRYWQEGHPSGATWSASYAHQWQRGPGWSLRYGIVLRSRPYDGVPERRREAFLQLSVPLP